MCTTSEVKMLLKILVALQVGSILYDAILAHMLRFRYSDFGALQLKRDMSEYQAAAASFAIARVDELFEQGMQLANTLIVPPASLPDVIDSGLQMDRATARKYVSLREDYATARVGGRPLSVVMGDASSLRPSPAREGVAGAKAAAAGAASRARGWMAGAGGGGASS
jgi:Exocyst complex component Sec10